MVTTNQYNARKKDLIDTMEILSSPDTILEIAEALETYELGKGKTLKQLKKELQTAN